MDIFGTPELEPGYHDTCIVRLLLTFLLEIFHILRGEILCVIRKPDESKSRFSAKLG
jgi:hypothetical protein